MPKTSLERLTQRVKEERALAQAALAGCEFLRGGFGALPTWHWRHPARHGGAWIGPYYSRRGAVSKALLFLENNS